MRGQAEISLSAELENLRGQHATGRVDRRIGTAMPARWIGGVCRETMVSPRLGGVACAIA